MATVSVHLPTALQRLFRGCPATVEVEADSVGAALDALDEAWPGLRDRVADSRPSIRRHMRVFVDGDRADIDTRTRPGARVEILTAISGG